MPITRRHFLRAALALPVLPHTFAPAEKRDWLHCTPAPTFPVPLDKGVWRSGAFPVGKHSYHVWLNVDRRLPIERLDCDLGPPRPGNYCSSPPLLDLECAIWDGKSSVKTWSSKPPQAAAWSGEETGCFLGSFEGKRNGMFNLELTMKKDAGRLKELHPRILIVKNPGYWCWL